MPAPPATTAQGSLPVVDTKHPAPPTDIEKYWYMGRQHRWLLVTQALSFGLIAYSMVKFATTKPWLLVFLVPISCYFVGLLVSLASSTRGKRTSEIDHDLRVAEYGPDKYPAVDVFLPTAGEPLDVLANTYQHVARMVWPGALHVYVLDDGARPEVAALAAQHGLTYLTRPNRGEFKKAGNLKYGYEHSDGDFIVVFDADFAPRPDFMANTVPYFSDDAVGIVQTPQFFDTAKGMHWLQRCAGATQELFYRWIQPSRDRSKAAICVGTNAVYRRAALARSGGFAQIGHSEDVHTGVNLLKVGYHVRYVPILLAKGLSPDTATGFLNQQYRWCTGSMSLLADPSFHANRNISARQRLCFWAGFLYYISTAINIFVAPVPAIVMVWLLPAYVYPHNSLWLLGAVTLWLVVLPAVMRGRWRIDVLRVQALYSFAHALAIVHILTGRTQAWVATGMANSAAQSGRSTPLSATIGRMMKVYLAVTQSALLVGMVLGTVDYGIDRFWAMWCLFAISLYVHVPLLFLKTNVIRLSIRSLASSARGLLVRPARPALVLPRQRQPSDLTLQAPRPRQFRPDIQGLRAVAVTAVVLYHARVPYLTGGYIGVDVFFVISGFLITSQLMREVDRTGRISFLGFYAGRARRLLPPAAIVVVATVIFARIYDSIFNVRSITTDAIFSCFYALNYRLAAKGVDYQHASDAVSPLQHLWSLAVEEQFYVFWPIIVLVTALVARRRRWGALTGVTLSLVAVSLYLSVTVTVRNPPYAYFSLHTRAWQLMAGALLALAVPLVRRIPAWLGAALSWAGLGGILYAAFAYNDNTPFPGHAALVPVTGTMLVIVGCANYRPFGAEWILGRRAMQGIGRVSYSWYLWHWPMLVLIPIAAGRKFGWPLKLEICVLSLWFAVLTLYLVEKPSQRSRLRRSAWLPAGLGISAGTVALTLAVATTIPSLVGSGSVATIAQSGSTGAIQGQLAMSLSALKAPTNLTPSIKKALDDVPQSSNDGCHANFLQVDQGACVFGDPHGTRTLVLFGDSHMEQWLPALDAEGKTLGWKVVSWTKAGCPIAALSAYPNDNFGGLYSQCPTWRAATEKRIVALHPDVVLLSQSDQLIAQVNNTKWSDATTVTALHFAAYKIPVIYLLDTPRPPVSGPQCVADHLGDIGACNFPLSQAYGVSKAVFNGRRDALKATLQNQKIPTFDPQWYLCARSAKPTCPAVVGNMMVYRDNSHMTATFSRYLASVTQPLFLGNTGPVASLADPFPGTATGGIVSPQVFQAGHDLPHYPADCIVPTLRSSSPECLIAPDGSPRNTPVTGNRVVLLGDSHAGQWFDPIQLIAARSNWDTEVLNKSGCPLSNTQTTNSELHRKFSECDKWRAGTLRRLLAEPRPKIIFVTQLNRYGATAAEWVQTLSQLRVTGAPIVYLQDTPAPETEIPACVADNINSWERCAFKRSDYLRPDIVTAGSAGIAAEVSVNRYLCPGTGDACPAVRDGVLLYRDNAGHVSRTAMMRLAPVIDAQLLRARLVPA